MDFASLRHSLTQVWISGSVEACPLLLVSLRFLNTGVDQWFSGSLSLVVGVTPIP